MVNSEKIARAIVLIKDMLHDDDCEYDHNSNCQTHDWFGNDECPHARAKRFLEEIEED